MIDLQENIAICCRDRITYHMDGDSLRRSCSDVAGCNPCHICEPNSKMAVFARNALLTPIPIQPKAPSIASSTFQPLTRHRSLTPYPSSEFTPSMAAAMDNMEQSFDQGSMDHSIILSSPQDTTIIGSKPSLPSTPAAGPSKFVLLLCSKSVLIILH
jgi:hypothetical protein